MKQRFLDCFLKLLDKKRKKWRELLPDQYAKYKFTCSSIVYFTKMCVQKWRGKLSTVNLELRLGLSCLTPLSTIFQFYGGGHTDLPQVTEQTISHNVVLSIPRPRVRFELTTLVVIGTDCICTCSCKSHYHMITTTTAPTDNLPMNDNWVF